LVRSFFQEGRTGTRGSSKNGSQEAYDYCRERQVLRLPRGFLASIAQFVRFSAGGGHQVLFHSAEMEATIERLGAGPSVRQPLRHGHFDKFKLRAARVASLTHHRRRTETRRCKAHEVLSRWTREKKRVLRPAKNDCSDMTCGGPALCLKDITPWHLAGAVLAIWSDANLPDSL